MDMIKDIPREWPNRLKILAVVVADEKDRAALYDIWFNGTSIMCPPPYDFGPEPGRTLAVLDFQISIGRALLDYPDVDRPSVRTRLHDLEAARRHAPPGVVPWSK